MSVLRHADQTFRRPNLGNVAVLAGAPMGTVADVSNRRSCRDTPRRRVDGSLTVPSATPDHALMALREPGTPEVFPDRDVTEDLPVVAVDDVAAARAVTAHLIERGSDTFALVNDPLNVSWSAHRPTGAMAVPEPGLSAAAAAARGRTDPTVADPGWSPSARCAPSTNDPALARFLHLRWASGVLDATLSTLSPHRT